jgi:hypothetical protein
MQVRDLDDKRRQSLQYISDLSPHERDDALARIKENELIVAWVRQCLLQRVSSYRWALERLVIHAPDGAAANVDRLIGQLASRTLSTGSQDQSQIRVPGRGSAPSRGLVVKD